MKAWQWHQPANRSQCWWSSRLAVLGHYTPPPTHPPTHPPFLSLYLHLVPSENRWAFSMKAFLFLFIYSFFIPSLSRPRLLLFYSTFLTAGCVLTQEDKTPPPPLSPSSVLCVGFPQCVKGPLVLMRHCYPKSCQTRTYYRHSSVTEGPQHFDRPVIWAQPLFCIVVHFFLLSTQFVLKCSVFMDAWQKVFQHDKKRQHNTYQCFSIKTMQNCYLLWWKVYSFNIKQLAEMGGLTRVANLGTWYLLD